MSTTETTTQTQSLRERALAASQAAAVKNHIENLERAEQERRDNLERFGQMLKEKLGVEIEPMDFTIEIDGIKLRYHPWIDDRRREIVLVGECPNCHGEAVSYALHDLTDLGNALGGQMAYHRCEPAREQSPAKPKIETGGQAFPCEDNGFEGMTLRDYFAAAALREFLSWEEVTTREAAARLAYEAADRMLVERSKR